MKAHSYTQINKIQENPQFYEAEEGGLNLLALKETIWRKIHIVGAITVTVSSLAFYQASRRTPNYYAGFEILSEPVTIETKVSSQSRETTEEITAVKLDEVQLKTLKSPTLIDSVVKQLKNKYPTIDYGSIVSTLDLRTIDEDQTILEINYKHPDGNLVKDVLNTIATTYLDYSLQKRRVGLSRGLEFLDQQIPKLEAKVDTLHGKLQQLREKHNYVDPQTQGRQLSARLDNLVQQQTTNQAELDKTEWISSLIQKELKKQPTTSTAAIQAGTDRFNELLKDLREIDAKIAQKSAIFSDKSLQIQTLKEERQELVSLIAQEGKIVQQKLNNQIEIFEEQDQFINEDIKSLKDEIQEWSDVTRDYEDIERQMNITSKQLNQLLVQREALRIESAQKESPWRLLTPPGTPQSDAASSLNYVVLGTALGLLLGVGAALALDKYQNLVYTSDQVKEITNLPILGVIPFDRYLAKLSFGQKMIKLMQISQVDESNIQIYNRDSDSPNLVASSTEPFRFFGANLGLFEAENAIHSFIVTSAISGEGKSTVALNLGKTAAAMGRRVLIVDTDMRSVNRISVSIALTRSVGLIDLLLNQKLNLHNVIQQSPLEEDLYILSTGNGDSITDPSKLLVSPRMKEVMETVKQDFDLVIYDVSSIIGYADVSLLATKTDGIVLVTGLGKLQSLKLKEAMNQLNISNAPVLGVVINQVA
jgi:capsular exopolysaccharide synthesis family protein